MRSVSLGAAHVAQPVFERMGWTFYDSQEVPSVERISETIDGLIDRVERSDWEDGFEIATGRFRVSYTEDMGLNIGLELFEGQVYG